MAWTISGQISPHARPGADANGWLWELVRDGEARRVLVEVAGTVWSMHERGGPLPRDVREAIASEGRSEVERVASMVDPTAHHLVLKPRLLRSGSRGRGVTRPLMPPGERVELEPSNLLVCAECGATSSPDAAGWRAYLDDDGQAVMFCPECAEREFDEIGTAE
jgi:hypothetical protein